MLKIIPLLALKDNYIWVLVNDDNRQAIIVDPGEAEPVLSYLAKENLNPCAILITHHHLDHVGGILDITKKYAIPVFTPRNETVQGGTQGVNEGNVLPFPALNLTLNVLDVPGHTAGAIAYYNDCFVFSGDTLFTAGCGRLFEGTAPQMLASLEKLKNLNDDTLLYCGHEYTEANMRFARTVEPNNETIKNRQQNVLSIRRRGEPSVPATLAMEKKTNPFLRCDSQAVIESASRYARQPLSTPDAVFSVVRSWKDNF